MISSSVIPLLTLLLSSIISPTVQALDDIEQWDTAYDASHHTFSENEGWQPISVSDLPYKYTALHSRALPDMITNSTQAETLHERRGTKKPQRKNRSPGKKGPSRIRQKLQKAWEKVTITWYTGHDLKNPRYERRASSYPVLDIDSCKSCWSNSGWSPTVRI